jgi:hypothetical protein
VGHGESCQAIWSKSRRYEKTAGPFDCASRDETAKRLRDETAKCSAQDDSFYLPDYVDDELDVTGLERG